MYKRLNITLAADVLVRADEFAARERYTRSGLIAAALDAFTGAEAEPVTRETGVAYGPAPAAAPARPSGPPSLEVVAPLVRAFFSARDDVVAAWVFGSVARDVAGPLSDVDVAFLATPEAGDRSSRFGLRLKFAGGLESVLRVPRVDVIALQDAPVVLAQRIVTAGARVFAVDPVAAAEAELRAITGYWDYAWALAEGDRRLREWVDANARG